MKSNSVILVILLGIALISCEKDESLNDTIPQQQETQNLFPEIAYPDQKGNKTTIQIGGEALEVEQIEDDFVFQGDMLFPVKNIENLQKATGRFFARWYGGIVFYDIDPSLPNQNRVIQAINHWEQNTPIRFVRRTNQPDYVVFRKGSGCSANVGRIGGVQYVNLADGCTVGSTIHEIGHTVGLWHEQSRKDRDQFVNIVFQNVTPGTEFNFQTYQQQNLDGNEYSQFDIGSIMMYGSFFFSKNGQPTITRKDGSTFNANRSALSALDKQGVKKMYERPYIIQATHSNKIIEVGGGSLANGANINQWPFIPSANIQKWFINHIGNGYFNFIAAHSGQALEIGGAATNDGANINQWPYFGGTNQQWKIENIAFNNQAVRIISRSTNKAMEIGGAATSDGANVNIWPYFGGANQHFFLSQQ